MITCGLKLTQSGGLALVEDGDLVFNIEIQKLDNNPRYSDVADLAVVPEIMSCFGYDLSDVDRWSVDGWDGAENGRISLRNEGRPVEVAVAPYRETGRVPDPVRPALTGELAIGREVVSFRSYVHVASHLCAAYGTSPFAARGEPSMVLVWDGGCFPRLYCVDAAGRVEPGGEAFPLIGHTYSMASQHWGPYRRDGKSDHVDDLSVAGKMMAYIALGRHDDDVADVLRAEFHRHFEEDSPAVRDYREAIIGCGSTGEPSHKYVHAFLADAKSRIDPLGVPDEDVLATVHDVVEELLIGRVTAKIRRWKGDDPWNLCFAGGCALNIKWNTAFRLDPMIRSMWVPPFPDDSGSAVGTACADLAPEGGISALRWHARLGPDLVRHPHVPAGWLAEPCRPEELARLLHRTGEPAVLLHGRAELGPRALGARSIIAPAR